MLNISIQTVRSWCSSGRIISIRGPSDGKRAGNRYISESELQRVRSDNAFTTVNEAVNRMQAIIDNRDAAIIDLINEKSHIQAHNFEVIGKVIDNLDKKIDRLERAAAAKPPATRISDKAVKHIVDIAIASASRSGPASPPTAPQTKPPDVTQVPAHSRTVSQAEHDSMMADINNR